MPGRFHQQRRTSAFPVRVMRPRRCFSPLESSPGTSPRYAINAGAEANRRSHATRRGSTWPSTYRCHRNSATIRPARDTVHPRQSPRAGHPTPTTAPRCDRSPTDSPRFDSATPLGFVFQNHAVEAGERPSIVRDFTVLVDSGWRQAFIRGGRAVSIRIWRSCLRRVKKPAWAQRAGVTLERGPSHGVEVRDDSRSRRHRRALFIRSAARRIHR
jgi:hypothetical protein